MAKLLYYVLIVLMSISMVLATNVEYYETFPISGSYFINIKTSSLLNSSYNNKQGDFWEQFDINKGYFMKNNVTAYIPSQKLGVDSRGIVFELNTSTNFQGKGLSMFWQPFIYYTTFGNNTAISYDGLFDDNGATSKAYVDIIFVNHTSCVMGLYTNFGGGATQTINQSICKGTLKWSCPTDATIGPLNYTLKTIRQNTSNCAGVYGNWNDLHDLTGYFIVPVLDTLTAGEWRRNITIDNLNISSIAYISNNTIFNNTGNETLNQMPYGSITYNSTTVCSDSSTYNYPFTASFTDPESDTIFYATTNNYANFTQSSVFTQWKTMGICPACVTFPYPDSSTIENTYGSCNNWTEDIIANPNYNALLPQKDLTNYDQYAAYMNPNCASYNIIHFPIIRTLNNINWHTDINGLSNGESMSLLMISESRYAYLNFTIIHNNTGLCILNSTYPIGCYPGDYNNFRFQYQDVANYQTIELTPCDDPRTCNLDTYEWNTTLTPGTNTIKYVSYQNLVGDFYILNYFVTGNTYTPAFSTAIPSYISIVPGANQLNVYVTDSSHLNDSYERYSWFVMMYPVSRCQSGEGGVINNPFKNESGYIPGGGNYTYNTSNPQPIPVTSNDFVNALVTPSCAMIINSGMVGIIDSVYWFAFFILLVILLFTFRFNFQIAILGTSFTMTILALFVCVSFGNLLGTALILAFALASIIAPMFFKGTGQG